MIMSLQHYECNKCRKRITCSTCDNSDGFLDDGDAHISFRVHVAFSSRNTVDDASLCYYGSKRLELKLQSAHDTSNNNNDRDTDPVELTSRISDFITYIIQKIYAGGNTRRSSSSIDRETDLQCLKILVNTYTPELKEACVVYHIVGCANSFAKIRQGFRNAEATSSSSSTFQIALCANESDDMHIVPKNGMNTDNGGGREVMDFILSANYGHLAVGTSKKIKRNAVIEEVSQVENIAQIKNNVHSDGQQITTDSQSVKRKRTENADSQQTRYPSKYHIMDCFPIHRRVSF